MEPLLAVELLRDQPRAEHLALGVAQQAAIGLLGERQLGDTGDQQRIGHAGDHAQHQQ
ncbi:Uncharacterised protein [Acinetobacter baumannii]|nr:Uncharacterised protein [Acinetobacter baumannii]